MTATLDADHDVLLNRLTLSNFRNYEELDMELGQGVTLIAGANAQGKTNLLEAVYLLATTRSPRTTSDSDFVNWRAARDETPVTRVAGSAVGQRGEVEVELAMAARASRATTTSSEPWPDDATPPQGLSVSKRLRLNGVPRRASDVIGAIPAVFFSTIDMDVISGAPALRRRYLDLMISQIDRAYVSALGRFTKVLSQRNALLKRLQEGAADEDELEFWDAELSREGGIVQAARARAVEALGETATRAHQLLSVAAEDLTVRYLPKIGDAASPQELAAASDEDAAALLGRALRAQRQREIGAGMTLAGPHRDDLAVLIDGAPAAAFGSRAQQRSAALSLRLAESELIRKGSGEQPVILLDDVLSELDRARQDAVLGAMSEFSQLLVTSAEVERFPEHFRQAARVFTVHAGVVSPA
ncbi:MAG TPA: DNA replication and repair protein RecF [Dehalococcoidia bacterium]|nr:DNA replication and repair protein RecF [Dehalococcoidia bacterium]